MIDNDLKIAVMYFSATGNCKRIAKGIAAYFENAVLLDFTLKLNQKTDVPPCDILFLITPVYSQLCPAPIKKFLKKLLFKGAIVPCVSYGSVSAGKALKQVCKIFQKKGSAILAAAEFATVHSYHSSSDSNMKIANEITGINELCEKALSRFNENKCLKKIPMRHFNPFSLFVPKLRAQIGVKLKYSDNSKCAGCGKCKDICPFGAITGKIKTNGECVRCGACVKNCENNNKQFVLCSIMHKYLNKHIDYSRTIEIY